MLLKAQNNVKFLMRLLFHREKRGSELFFCFVFFIVKHRLGKVTTVNGLKVNVGFMGYWLFKGSLYWRNFTNKQKKKLPWNKGVAVKNGK